MDAITITMVSAKSPKGAKNEAFEPTETIPELKPKTTPRPVEVLPETKPVPEIAPESPVQSQVQAGQQNQTAIDIIQSEELTTTPGAGMPAKPHIPSRWALKPPLAEQRLQGLGFSQEDIECLTSLEDHCRDLRKDVFAEYQLTETELVWTPNRPDTGMPAEFRGLSEQEILENWA